MTLERKNKKGAFDWFVIFILLSLATFGIIWWVTSSIREHHLQDDPKLHQLKEMLTPLHPVVKDLKLYKGKKSYTINKEKIYLCLKDENNNYYSNNMLIYVLLHEMAHLLNKDDIGHTEKFHEIFEGLIEKAHEMGIYNTSIPPVQNYCMHDKHRDDD
jgi:hypothetical protein